MKFKSITVAVIRFVVISISLSVFAAEQPRVKPFDGLSRDAANAQPKIDRVELMDRKKLEIGKRVGMSSCLEISDAGEKGLVTMALEQGLILEVTLEEVEAALKAAAATPQREDDLAAMNLAHWGSYRFFLDEKPSAATSRK